MMNFVKPMRSFIILIIIILLVSYFPLFISGNSYAETPQTNGNLYIQSGTTFVINENTVDPLTGLTGQFGMSGSLFVNSSATLIIENATLYFRQDIFHHYRMIVNGTLIMNNAVIETSFNAVQPYLPLNISFFNSYIKTNGAEFLFPGHIYFYKSTLLMKNTVFNKLQNIPSELNNGNVSDSSPTPSFYYSTGYFDNVSFKNMFNPTMIGDKLIINATSSHIPDNISAISSSLREYSIIPESNYPPQIAISGINILLKFVSNANVNVSLYANGINLPISIKNLPSTNGKEEFFNITALFSNVSSLKLDNLYNDNLYALFKITSSTGYFNVTGLNFLIFSNDTFNYYGGNSSFYFNMFESSIYGMNVFIDSNFLNNTIYNGTERNIKNLISLNEYSNLSLVNLTIAGSISSTNMITANSPFQVDPTSSVNIYRYLNVNVENYQGYPVSGVKISAIETWPNNYPNAIEYDELATGLNNNFHNILISKGFISSSFNITSEGIATIPLLSDIITSSTSPNSLIMGHYEIQMPDGITRNVTLNSFPSLNATTNVESINVNFDSPFVYYYINSISKFIYGDNANINIIATSFSSPINGTFILSNNTTQLAVFPVTLNPNVTSSINMTFMDMLSPGKETLKLEFFSYEIYSSTKIVDFNITSYSNVNLITSVKFNPKYEMNGSMISGYGANLTITVENNGNQSSGVVRILTNYTTPNGETFSLPIYGIIGAQSAISSSVYISPFNITSAGNIIVEVTANTTAGIIPYSTSKQNFSGEFPVIPRPFMKIISTSFSNEYLYGVPAQASILLYSNEPIYNANLLLRVNNQTANYNIRYLNGYLNKSISIPASFLNVGINNVNISLSSIYPFVFVGENTSMSLNVEKNFGFEITNERFLLASNISNYVNGYLLFTILNAGYFQTSKVPVEITYNGVPIFQGMETTNGTIQLPLNVTYSPIMNFGIIVNYNFSYPSSFTFYPYMYLNSSLEYPYIYSSYNLPSQVTNGSSIKGSFSIDDVTNYYSNNTVIYYYLGNNEIYQEYLGNISQGFSKTIDINVSTSKLVNIMNNESAYNYNSYFIIKDTETGNFGIMISVGQITILERPNFELSNISILSSGHNVSTIYAGQAFNIQFTVTNMGGISSSTKVPYRIVIVNNSTSYILYSGITNESILPGQSITIITNQITLKSIFSGLLKVYFNYGEAVYTKTQQTANYSISFKVINPRLIFYVTAFYSTLNAGKVQTIQIRAINSNNSQPWETNITVIVFLGTKIIERINGQTNSLGIFTFSFKTITSGTYNLEILYQGPTGGLSQTYSDIFKVNPTPLTIPIYVYPVIIVIVIIAVVLWVLRYIGRKTTGLVQCSVCGAILPENATKCPRCGTEFERDRVKCSECGSWIPEDSKYCPNCGALFIGKSDPEYAGYSKLKNEFEAYLNKYRQKAKAILGDKMNELEFQNWWRNNPDYKSFKQWIMEKGLSPVELTNKAEEIKGADSKNEKKKGLLRRNKK